MPGNGLNAKRMKGLEPSTFCMASRRSSQLSYIRGRGNYSGDPDAVSRRVAATSRAQRAAVSGSRSTTRSKTARKSTIALRRFSVRS